ncbi:Sterol uptake control protein 2 [Fusarium oxysporum f. sp. albedinis]|nr:Sterol uptake control protein 2 [Fusarium oxysporum f. sp. albedinis]
MTSASASNSASGQELYPMRLNGGNLTFCDGKRGRRRNSSIYPRKQYQWAISVLNPYETAFYTLVLSISCAGFCVTVFSFSILDKHQASISLLVDHRESQPQ